MKHFDIFIPIFASMSPLFYVEGFYRSMLGVEKLQAELTYVYIDIYMSFLR